MCFHRTKRGCKVRLKGCTICVLARPKRGHRKDALFLVATVLYGLTAIVIHITVYLIKFIFLKTAYRDAPV